MVDERQFERGISVIVPAYKSEKYITKLLNSIENQTLDNELFEVLVIINGERDETESIIKDFQINHPDINIRLFESEKGASAARNVGLDNLKGSTQFSSMRMIIFLQIIWRKFMLILLAIELF